MVSGEFPKEVSIVPNETDLRKDERIWSCEGYRLALADSVISLLGVLSFCKMHTKKDKEIRVLPPNPRTL